MSNHNLSWCLEVLAEPRLYDPMDERHLLLVGPREQSSELLDAIHAALRGGEEHATLLLTASGCREPEDFLVRVVDAAIDSPHGQSPVLAYLERRLRGARNLERGELLSWLRQSFQGEGHPWRYHFSDVLKALAGISAKYKQRRFTLLIDHLADFLDACDARMLDLFLYTCKHVAGEMRTGFVITDDGGRLTEITGRACLTAALGHYRTVVLDPPPHLQLVARTDCA